MCGIMCYIILPRLIASTPPPIRGVGGTWALAHFIIKISNNIPLLAVFPHLPGEGC